MGNYLALLGAICDGTVPPRFGVAKNETSTIGVVVEMLPKRTESIGPVITHGMVKKVVTKVIDRFRIKASNIGVYPCALAIVEPYRDIPPLTFPMGTNNVFPDTAMNVNNSRGRVLSMRKASMKAKEKPFFLQNSIRKCKHPKTSQVYMDSKIWSLFNENELVLRARIEIERFPWLVDFDEQRIEDTPRKSDNAYRWSMWFSSIVKMTQEDKSELLVETCTALRLRKIIWILRNSNGKRKGRRNTGGSIGVGKKRKRSGGRDSDRNYRGGGQSGRGRIRRKVGSDSDNSDPARSVFVGGGGRGLLRLSSKQDDIVLDDWPVSNIEGFSEEKVKINPQLPQLNQATKILGHDSSSFCVKLVVNRNNCAQKSKKEQ